MVPFVRINVGQGVLKRETSKQLYFKNKAMYNNLFQMKLTDIESLEEATVEVEVFNGGGGGGGPADGGAVVAAPISSSGVSSGISAASQPAVGAVVTSSGPETTPRHVGRGSVLLSALLPMLNREELVSIPLWYEPKYGAARQKGKVAMRGMVRFVVPGVTTNPLYTGVGVITPIKARTPGNPTPFATPSPPHRGRAYTPAGASPSGGVSWADSGSTRPKKSRTGSISTSTPVKTTVATPTTSIRTPLPAPTPMRPGDTYQVATFHLLHVSSITAQKLTKIALLGRQARRSPMRENPVSFVKESEIEGKQVGQKLSR
jgi:hypothetical protein